MNSLAPSRPSYPLKSFKKEKEKVDAGLARRLIGDIKPRKDRSFLSALDCYNLVTDSGVASRDRCLNHIYL